MDQKEQQKYMETLQQQIEGIAAGFSPEEGEKIRRAYRFAAQAHQDQLRRSGEPYIMHPVAVACIIDQMGLDAESVMAGLLHDTVEDTPVTREDIAREFGAPVAMLVDGVTKLTKMEHTSYSTKEEQQMEDLRKMFIAMAKDIRVIMIKLADRLHNMRTIQYQKVQKQRDISVETMEIYAPLAHRLGMQGVKWELEDRSLKILDPVGYKEISDFLEDKSHGFAAFLEETKKRIQEKLEQAGIACQVKARLKSVYSIYRKLYGQNLSFAELYDICATRVIVKELTDCYNVLGLIHDLYKPVPGRFKDYISTPKPNGYQSLHTVVIGSEGIPFEVQIRTEEMDHRAEYGIAAHWKYKDGLKGSQKEEAFAWVRQLIETQQDTDASDFIKNIKTDLFADEVYVFTPRGDVINLPQGATPIDFAYAIHSAVGNRMTGAKVNGRIVPIDYQLKSGEIVDVITSKTAAGPKRDWMQIVKTNGARTKIKQWFKKERRDENIEQGKAALDRELRANLLYDAFQQPEMQSLILKRLEMPDLTELYASLGYGGIAMSRVIAKVRDELQRQRAAEQKEAKLEAKLAAQTARAQRSVADTGVIVEGLDNCLVKFAKCCSPLPGDPIIGFVTRGYGVSVHRQDCANVRAALQNKPDDGRWIRTEWAMNERHQYSAGIRVTTKSRVGAITDVLTVLTNMKINVSEMNAKEMDDGQCDLFLTITVSDAEQMELVLSRILRANGVIQARRIVAGS
ncbi:MAG: bifunctional (p)ppGpp synthetase/guanosine-3',5'-bis(diphosphate) 3'-pyrophosphohydrolase [Clostridia bacterium]|nr:bifunctional (p)ppGpp synthetase/guanosine-3',5'-bis(diphosphate) 3'-pyrophosphohydrolase [Clostridia bacterium]